MFVTWCLQPPDTVWHASSDVVFPHRHGLWGCGRRGRSQQAVSLVPHAELVSANRSRPPRPRNSAEHRIYPSHHQIQIWLLQEMSRSPLCSLPSSFTHLLLFILCTFFTATSIFGTIWTVYYAQCMSPWALLFILCVRVAVFIQLQQFIANREYLICILVHAMYVCSSLFILLRSYIFLTRNVSSRRNVNEWGDLSFYLWIWTSTAILRKSLQWRDDFEVYVTALSFWQRWACDLHACTIAPAFSRPMVPSSSTKLDSCSPGMLNSIVKKPVKVSEVL